MKVSPLQLLLRRLAAFLYDCLLLIALFFIITGVAILANEGNAIQSPLYKLFLIPVTAIFFSWFWKSGGQTLGMRAWHLKVVNNDQHVLTWKRCFIRFTIGLVFFAVTYLWMFFNRERAALHDQLSNTSVIYKKPKKT